MSESGSNEKGAPVVSTFGDAEDPKDREDSGDEGEREESRYGTGPSRLLVLIPVFNDWEAVGLLLPAVDRELERNELEASVLLVDDGSTEPCPLDLLPSPLRAVREVEILTLRRNLGHQRALAVGLAFLEANRRGGAVVVMDADGEDDPRDIPRLLRAHAECGGARVVFAERTRRAEGFVFRAFYHLYRLLHWVTTGIRVRAGNYSVLPRPLLRRLVAASELWNHYAAAVHKIRLPIGMVPTRRAPRLTGSSRMSFVSLAAHGLSAVSVFGDRVGVRMLASTAVLGALTAFFLAGAFILHATAGFDVPSWLTYSGLALLFVLLQAFMTSVLFVFIVLHHRDGSSTVPCRDYPLYVEDCRVVHARHQRVQLHR